MKIAIHHREGSFSDRWIRYCEENEVLFKVVNCYDNDIIEQLADCDALMWHHHHANYKDVLFAKQLLNSVSQSGKSVFPDYNSNWHFDDKVGQKYLLESIGAPFVKSYVFYTKQEALKWMESTTYPKVFKLRGGAGASNVKLIRTKKDALFYISKAFGRGFSKFDRIGYLKDEIRKFKINNNNNKTLIGIFKGIARLFISTKFAKILGKEKGYAYFQEFIPNNTFDIRVIVVGEKAFAVKRMTRENDFRASGSGLILYEKKDIDERCIKIAFDVNKKLKTQSIAYDFVFDKENKPLIIEISYGYDVQAYNSCPGYWDIDLNYFNVQFIPQYWQIESLISILK